VGSNEEQALIVYIRLSDEKSGTAEERWHERLETLGCDPASNQVVSRSTGIVRHKAIWQTRRQAGSRFFVRI